MTMDNYPSVATTQGELIDIINKYYLSQFRDGDTDVLGEKKVFYNIVNLPVEVAAKMIDLDTKDINLIGEDWGSYWPAWIMSKELRMWMKEKYFGKQLNLYSLILPKYGDLWVKKVGEDVLIVPIENLIFHFLISKNNIIGF